MDLELRPEQNRREEQRKRRTRTRRRRKKEKKKKKRSDSLAPVRREEDVEKKAIVEVWPHVERSSDSLSNNETYSEKLVLEEPLGLPFLLISQNPDFLKGCPLLTQAPHPRLVDVSCHCEVLGPRNHFASPV